MKVYLVSVSRHGRESVHATLESAMVCVVEFDHEYRIVQHGNGHWAVFEQDRFAAIGGIVEHEVLP